MAWNYGNKKGKGYGKKSGYTEAEKLAYKLGQIEVGLKNSNSKVSESYIKGANSTKIKEKKPLF